ncbi:MAG TPA: flagellar biosynthesis protein FliQ [Candidatus Limnocylindrales bacterium]
MNTTDVGAVMQQALYTTLMVAGPIVMISMAVGLAISVLQAATQINEATLTFVPKLIVVAIVLIVLGPMMSSQLTDFTRYVFQAASQAGH